MTTGIIFSWLTVTLISNLSAGVTEAKQKSSVELRVGDTAPVFASIDDQGSPWKLSDHVGQKIVVLYFYPADFTSGCTRQAAAWHDNLDQLSKLGAEVVGVSADSVSSHQLFKKLWKLNFTLLSDEQALVAHGAVVVGVTVVARARFKGAHT